MCSKDGAKTVFCPGQFIKEQEKQKPEKALYRVGFISDEKDRF